MKLHVFYKNLQATPALNAHIHQKFDDIVDRYLNDGMTLQVTCEVTKHDALIHALAKPAHGPTIMVKEEGEDMYECIDRLADRTRRVLRKAKEKKADKKWHHIDQHDLHTIFEKEQEKRYA